MNARITSLGGALMWAAALTTAGAQGRVVSRQYSAAVTPEETSETSANVSAGDLDGDGDLDLVLAKGRHWPLADRVLLNDGKGRFSASDLGPTHARRRPAISIRTAGSTWWWPTSVRDRASL